MAQVRPMIRNVAQYLQQLAEETQAHFNSVNRKLDQYNRVLDAIVTVVGKEAVEKALADKRASEQKAFEDAQDAATLKLVDAGGLTAIETVQGDSLVVGTDTYKDGAVRKVRFEMAGLSDEQKAKFLGSKVGDEVTANEVTFKVAEIYQIHQEVIAKMVQPPAVDVGGAEVEQPKKAKKGRR